MNYLNPAPAIGGLEVSDLALRFLLLRGEKITQASVPLPPGIIVNGKIVERDRLVSAFKALHEQIEKPKKIVHAVVVMPTSQVYTQSFSMPIVSEKAVQETARLNMEMVSPIDAKTAYSDYQIVGETKPGQMEALAAFVAAKDVDDMLAVLREAHFDVIAVEFTGLSLMRLIKNYSAGLKADTPYLVVGLSGDGPDVMIVKNGHLYFNYFNSWATMQQEVGGRKLTAKDVQEFLALHVRQVLNFYTSRWGGAINDIVLIPNPISKELTATVKENFGISAQLLTIGKYNKLSPLWYVSLGAALRGLTPRSKDNDLTLTATGVDVGYYRQSLLNFIKTWRNISVFVLSFIAAVFLIGDIFLISSASGVSESLNNRTLVPLADIQALQDDVKKFNQNVDFALKAQDLSDSWAPLFDRISANIKLLAGQTIKIERLYIDSNFSALMIAKASNDSAVINFKNAMAKEPNFVDVVLPLSNIKVNSDGTVSFTLQFKISSLKPVEESTK